MPSSTKSVLDSFCLQASTPVPAISDNTAYSELRLLGYAGKGLTGHGFRSMSSALLETSGWNRNATERQFVHRKRDAIRAAYNFAEFSPERRKMTKAWVDYLDDLRHGK